MILPKCEVHLTFSIVRGIYLAVTSFFTKKLKFLYRDVQNNTFVCLPLKNQFLQPFYFLLVEFCGIV